MGCSRDRGLKGRWVWGKVTVLGQQQGGQWVKALVEVARRLQLTLTLVVQGLVELGQEAVWRMLGVRLWHW